MASRRNHPRLSAQGLRVSDRLPYDVSLNEMSARNSDSLPLQLTNTPERTGSNVGRDPF
jgi:hypothetical protein